jgi:hypothetical protein
MIAVVTSLVFGVLLGQQTPDKSNTKIRLQSKDVLMNRICEGLLKQDNLDCIVSDGGLIIVVYGVKLDKDGLAEFTNDVKLQVLDPAEEYAERAVRRGAPWPAFIIPAVKPDMGLRYQYDRFSGRVKATGTYVHTPWEIYESIILKPKK